MTLSDFFLEFVPPQVGLELTTLRLTAGYSDREAEFQISRPTSVSQSYRHPHAWNSSVRFIGDCAAWELVTLGVPAFSEVESTVRRHQAEMGIP